MAKRYTRINWQNKPNTATPLSAYNLNIMDKGIKDCDDAIGDLALLTTNNKTDLVSAINEQNNKFTQQLTMPIVVSDRATNAVGGYIKIGNLVFVSLKFTANLTGTAVLLFQGFPGVTNYAALTAVNTTDNTATGCFISSNTGYLNINCTSGKVYSVSGCYVAD